MGRASCRDIERCSQGFGSGRDSLPPFRRISLPLPRFVLNTVYEYQHWLLFSIIVL